MAQAQQLQNAVADNLIAWIQQQPFFTDGQQTNYCVALTNNNNVIITKVGGVTKAARAAKDLLVHIPTLAWAQNFGGHVYLAKKFSTAVDSSNHGEMCVLAAAKELGDQVVYIKCTGDNCQACAFILQAEGVPSGNVTAAGTQTGWVHPEYPLALGTQLATNWNDQIAELREFHNLARNARKNFVPKYMMALSSGPTGGITILI